MSLRSELDTLASALCKKATQDATPIEQSTDALKAAAAYYAIREKVKLKSSDDDDGATPSNFGDFANAIKGGAGKEPPHGRPAQPPASRRRDS